MKVRECVDWKTASGIGYCFTEGNPLLDATVLLPDCDVCRGKPQEFMSCGCSKRPAVIVPKEQREAAKVAVDEAIVRQRTERVTADTLVTAIATALLGGKVYRAKEVGMFHMDEPDNDDELDAPVVVIKDETGPGGRTRELWMLSDGDRIAILEKEDGHE